MKKLLTIIAFIVASAAMAVSFTNVDVPANHGKTGIKQIVKDVDANFDVLEIGSTTGTGTASGTVVTEGGAGPLHYTTITFTNATVALADATGTCAYGSANIYTLPQGNIVYVGATSNLALTKSSTGVNVDWDGDFGIGTAAAAADATLSATEQNLLPTTATPQAAAGATTAKGESTASEHIVIDGTSTASKVYLNLLVDDADHDVTTTPCNLVLNGTITIVWINTGDN